MTRDVRESEPKARKSEPKSRVRSGNMVSPHKNKPDGKRKPNELSTPDQGLANMLLFPSWGSEIPPLMLEAEVNSMMYITND